MTPALCPDCLRAGIIATADGPTCRHVPKPDAAWFPDWWTTAPEDKRTEYIERMCSQDNNRDVSNTQRLIGSVSQGVLQL